MYIYWHRSYMYIHTSINCIQTHTQTLPYVPIHVLANTARWEGGFAQWSQKRNANARIIYAKFVRRRAWDERAWQNTECKMSNAGGLGQRRRGPQGRRENGIGIGDLRYCSKLDRLKTRTRASVISQIVRIIFRFRPIKMFVWDSYLHLFSCSFSFYYLVLSVSLRVFLYRANKCDLFSVLIALIK